MNSCTHCVYLGQRGLFDLYVCLKEVPMVLARFDHDDRDVKAGLLSESDDLDLIEAVKRAAKLSLIKMS